MSEKKLKDFMDEENKRNEVKSDKEIFEELELDIKDITALKTITLSEEPSLSALINLVLREKLGRVINDENKEELLLRGFINENNNVTSSGKEYIETEKVKNRLQKII